MNESEELQYNIDAARKVEEYFAGPFKEEWHKVWQEGRLAQTQGISRKDNPQRLKVWRAVWEYGWDAWNPIPTEFSQVEANLDTLPTKPVNEND